MPAPAAPRPRSREEEKLVRECLPELTKAFPDALICRNEANAVMLFYRSALREIENIGVGGDLYKRTLIHHCKKALTQGLNTVAPMFRFGLGIGSADVIVCHRGRFIALEFKSEDGVQSDEQKTWQGWVEKAGGCYFIVRSIAEAIEAIQSV